MANTDLTPEQIEVLNSYADAFRSEFENSQKERKNPKEQSDDIHAQLDDVVPHALAAIEHVIKHSVNESLRVNTSKWLLDKKLDRDKEVNDPLTKLLEDMRQSVDTPKAEGITEAEYKAGTETP